MLVTCCDCKCQRLKLGFLHLCPGPCKRWVALNISTDPKRWFLHRTAMLFCYPV